MINNIINDYKNIPDLKIKEIKVSLFKYVYIIFIESLVDTNMINDFILKNIKISKTLNNIYLAPNIKEIKDNEINDYLNNGFTIVINKRILAIETKKNLTRSISNTTKEPSLNGPEDAFNENYQINVGLIKRRIKTNDLKSIEYIVGNNTKTKISVNYIDTLVDKEFLNNILNKLNNYNKDIFDVSMLSCLFDDKKSIFPVIKKTERPDNAIYSLLKGKIIIIVDTSPYVLILPTYFTDFINPINDIYINKKNAVFLKMLRMASFFISIIMPSLFVAITNYNPETIPTDLLINFSIQKSNVVFPTIIELLILLIICDILRESDLRYPSNYGSTISILGALIIGEAAVNAGLVSSIAIIIAAFTFITSLLFTELEINNVLRYYRYLFLLFASILGLYGIFIASIIFLINISSIKIFNIPYLSNKGKDNI